MSYKAHMHGGGKSSDCIVPTKCANKGGGPSAERMEGRRSAEETSRHGPMLDTAPENIGALQCRGNACSRYRLGAERSEVGTVCVKRASTGLCGGQPATAVPTATLRGVSVPPRSRPAREGAEPQGGHARAGEVGPRCNTDEPAEQRGAILRGDWGGKGADQGEPRSVQHEPDTERGTSVPGIERCAASSKRKEAGTIHRFAPPSHCRSAPRQLLRFEATSCPRSGWSDLEGV